MWRLLGTQRLREITTMLVLLEAVVVFLRLQEVLVAEEVWAVDLVAAEADAEVNASLHTKLVSV